MRRSSSGDISELWKAKVHQWRSRWDSVGMRPGLMVEWARQDSNLGPTDYEPAALTAELRARTS